MNQTTSYSREKQGESLKFAVGESRHRNYYQCLKQQYRDKDCNIRSSVSMIGTT